MQKLRASWLPTTVTVFCAWCSATMQEMTLAQVRNSGKAAIRCRNCGGLNTLPSDLLTQAQKVPVDPDPDNPPGRAEAWERILGNGVLKRAMEIAIAGYHTLVYVGDPAYAWKDTQEVMGPWARVMQPCPCGHFLAHDGEPCTCTWDMIEAHRKTRAFSDALDCDLMVRVTAPDFFDDESEPYASVYKRVQEVRMSQAFGVAMQPRPEWASYRHIGDAPSFQMLNEARKRWDFSTRRLLSVQRVAHTIALLDGDNLVRTRHMAEALSFRTPLQDA
jgi:predicted ATPase with chaperone activity